MTRKQIESWKHLAIKMIKLAEMDSVSTANVIDSKAAKAFLYSDQADAWFYIAGINRDRFLSDYERNHDIDKN